MLPNGRCLLKTWPNGNPMKRAYTWRNNLIAGLSYSIPHSLGNPPNSRATMSPESQLQSRRNRKPNFVKAFYDFRRWALIKLVSTFSLPK